MKRNDFIIAGAALFIAVVWLLLLQLGSRDGSEALVFADGILIGTYTLSEPDEVLIAGANGGSNLLVIQDGYASVTEASCPDKLCVHQRKIHKQGETIVCLPNRVVVEISGGEGSGYDAVTN